MLFSCERKYPHCLLLVDRRQCVEEWIKQAINLSRNQDQLSLYKILVFYHYCSKWFVIINISGSIIDEADSVSLYPSNHPVVTADTDKHSEQQTLSCMSDGDFTLTHMYGYRNFLRDTQGKAVDEEELKVRVSSSKHCQVCYGVDPWPRF